MANWAVDLGSSRNAVDTAPIALTRSHSDVRAAIGAKTSSCLQRKHLPACLQQIGNDFAISLDFQITN